MKTRPPLPSTPAYDAWIVAERKAAEAQRVLRESTTRQSRRERRPAPDPDVSALAAQLQNEAAALFAQAMEEMESAVKAALSHAHMRLH